MLDKALPEYKVVERVLIDRTAGAFIDIANQPNEADVDEVEFADCISYLKKSSVTTTCLSWVSKVSPWK